MAERIEALVEPHTKGDPMRPLRWTSKVTHKLSAELKSEGISVSHNTVGNILQRGGRWSFKSWPMKSA